MNASRAALGAVGHGLARLRPGQTSNHTGPSEPPSVGQHPVLGQDHRCNNVDAIAQKTAENIF
eukprot:11198833-Alexandrium_andersonii.AAC.1